MSSLCTERKALTIKNNITYKGNTLETYCNIMLSSILHSAILSEVRVGAAEANAEKRWENPVGVRMLHLERLSVCKRLRAGRGFCAIRDAITVIIK